MAKSPQSRESGLDAQNGAMIKSTALAEGKMEQVLGRGLRQGG